jgi:hypothetical protein
MEISRLSHLFLKLLLIWCYVFAHPNEKIDIEEKKKKRSFLVIVITHMNVSYRDKNSIEEVHTNDRNSMSHVRV